MAAESEARRPLGVLFVCHANLCRSPLAEGIFRAMVREQGCAARFDIDSAGTFALEGQAPHPASVAIAQEHGVALQGESRSIIPSDMERFDHILTMDASNLDAVTRLVRMSAFGAVAGGQQRARIRMLTDVGSADSPTLDAEIHDPLRRGPSGFAEVYEEIDAACRRLFDELREQS